MRPRRLEISGFTSFKERTEIEFEGSDFFALVGPTGSGKSSVIDAICFALYGSVPRYDNKNLVAPVISHGKIETKVLLDFAIDGKDYTAIRVVRRAGKGASTKEARLEAGGEVLAGNADEVTEAVSSLVGLSFEHFTKCVVLPQGEFARFLHDKPGERQDLVVKLLNLGVYERMRRSATVRAAQKRFELERAQARLTQELQFATSVVLKEARARAKRLSDLRIRVTAAKPELDKAEKTADEARAKARESARSLGLVSSLRVPSGVDDLCRRVEDVGLAVVQIEERAGSARREVEAAVALRKKLPARDRLTAALAAHDRKSKLSAQLETVRAGLMTVEQEHLVALKALQEADAAVPQAERAKTEIERAHAARHVARHLEKGQPCPVCLQPVSKLPKHEEIPGLQDAVARLDAARALQTEARKVEQRVATARARARSELELLDDQLIELEAELVDHPDRSEVAAELELVQRAERALETARSAEDEVRREHDRLRKEAAALQQKEEKERNRFDAARDQVAALGPPAASRRELASDWKALVEWARNRAVELTGVAEEATRDAVEAEAVREALVEGLISACTDCELEVDRDDDPLAAVVEAHTEAKKAVADIAAAIEEAKELRRDMKIVEIEQKTAEDLALHLSARPGRFESWLVNAALRRLVDGATEVLHQLSNGQYALTVDEQGAFQVIDRHNADETRSAKTLSGGETFLASLALALALADQLADLASDGAASLEAIFLDEGFGTLDPETLDTVAATVENLAESGRMVGIVTHVRELAERVPVQFRVRKDLRTSTVERVVA